MRGRTAASSRSGLRCIAALRALRITVEAYALPALFCGGGGAFDEQKLVLLASNMHQPVYAEARGAVWARGCERVRALGRVMHGALLLWF